MRLGLLTRTVIGAGALCAGPAALADGGAGVLLDGGRIIFDGRLRLETVEQDGFADDAVAPTLRVRAGFQTGTFLNLQLLVEGEGLVHLGDDFNDTVNGNVGYPVVTDPEGFELNRLQVDYTGLPDTLVTVGRQRINLDNQRFVGAVGFRQNEQTFDAFRIANTSVKGLSINYVFVNQVNRFFGNESPQGEFEGPTHLFNASYALPRFGKLTGYAYLVDLEEAPALSTATFGARLAGSGSLGDGLSARYAVEYAYQKDHADNPLSVGLHYGHGEVAVGYEGFSLLGGVETLEGDGAVGFSTPLATLHKFQGFADVFVNTPANGIVDVYVGPGYEATLEAPVGPLTGVFAAVTLHGFKTELGRQDLGSELDAEVVARFGEHVSVGAKYADYDGDGGFASRRKLWLQLDVVY
jgi:hypothetical protein